MATVRYRQSQFMLTPPWTLHEMQIRRCGVRSQRRRAPVFELDELELTLRALKVERGAGPKLALRRDARRRQRTRSAAIVPTEFRIRTMLCVGPGSRQAGRLYFG